MLQYFLDAVLSVLWCIGSHGYCYDENLRVKNYSYNSEVLQFIERVLMCRSSKSKYSGVSDPRVNDETSDLEHPRLRLVKYSRRRGFLESNLFFLWRYDVSISKLIQHELKTPYTVHLFWPKYFHFSSRKGTS